MRVFVFNHVGSFGVMVAASQDSGPSKLGVRRSNLMRANPKPPLDVFISPIALPFSITVLPCFGVGPFITTGIRRFFISVL